MRVLLRLVCTRNGTTTRSRSYFNFCGFRVHNFLVELVGTDALGDFW